MVPRNPRLRSSARDSATVAGWTLLSRITGLLRVLVVGAVLGPTYLANVFVTTNTVPSLIYAAIAGPVLAMVVVPAVVTSLAERGPELTVALLGRLTGFVLSTTAVVVMLVLLVSPVLAWDLTLAVEDGPGASRAFWLTVLMLAAVAPQVPLYCLAAICGAAQQARGRFALPAGASALENVGLMVTMAVVAVWYPRGLEIDAAPVEMVVVLGVGSTISVALHTLLQMIGAARLGLPIRPSLGWRRDRLATAVAHRVRRSVSVAAAPSMGLLLLFGLAATVPGGAVALQTSVAIYAFVVALGARSVASAVLPRLSAVRDNADGAAFAAAWRQSLFYMAVASVPATVLLVAFAGPAANILANGQLRTETFIATLAACIAVFGVAQVSRSLQEIGLQALFARLDLQSPRRAAYAGLAVTVVAGGVALLLPAGPARVVALSATVLVADTVSAGIVLRRLRTVLRPHPFADRAGLRTVLRATGLIVPVAAVASWLARHAPDRLSQMVLIGVAGCLAVVLLVITVRRGLREVSG
jgi:putative peptidoglycan lipid II flippase